MAHKRVKLTTACLRHIPVAEIETKQVFHSMPASTESLSIACALQPALLCSLQLKCLGLCWLSHSSTRALLHVTLMQRRSECPHLVCIVQGVLSLKVLAAGELLSIQEVQQCPQLLDAVLERRACTCTYNLGAMCMAINKARPACIQQS